MRTKTFVLMLAVVGLSAGAALGQTTTYVPLDKWIVDRDNANDQHITEQHWNYGGNNSTCRVWARVHQYYGDWDTVTMDTEITALNLPSYTAYPTPIYKLWVGISPAEGGWSVLPAVDPISICSIWSTNDWIESNATSTYPNYNWTNPMVEYAATHTYAQDREDIFNPGNSDPNAVPWHFPGTGSDPAQDCNFWGTFVRLDPAGDGYANSCHWSWSRSLMNSTKLQGDSTMHDTMASVVLDQAMIDDLLTNGDNRGMVLMAGTASGPQKRRVYMKTHQGNPGPWAMNITVGFDAWSGDGNLDGCVDGLDYVMWSNNYDATPSSWPEGDYNLDGTTDGLDYVVWSNNYNAGCPGLPGAVPEPATMALLAVGALALIRRRR